MRRRSALLALVLTASLLGSPAGPAWGAPSLTCGDIPDLTTIYLQKHLRFQRLTDELRERTAETYVQRLDPQRVLLLRADAERIRDSLFHVFAEAEEGDCSRLTELHKEVSARRLEIEGFVRGFVGRDDYALDEQAELVLDPEKRGYPDTRARRDALLRTLAHFQISNYLSSGSDLAEARDRLIHRYELQTQREAELSRSELYSRFLDAFAASMDPHSSYLSPDVLEDFQIQMQLSLEGIGVALSERDGYSVVESIIAGGAADRLNVLRPKDKIIAVAEDGAEPVDVIDMALRNVVRLIRGKKGTRVHLTVLRQGESTERFRVSILRDTIDLEQQAAKLRIESLPVGDRTLKLGVIELPSFYGDRDPSKRQGSRDVARLLKQARDEGVEGLLLDLSRNGGGLLEDAVTISGYFIRKGGIVAIRSTEGSKRVLDDPDNSVLYPGPLVVLVSRVSASASEILAGAMKDYRRAVVVGDDHTFGKGTVQSVFPLRKELGALKVTTALFFRPGGISTQHSGVASDVVVPSLFNSDDFGERDHPHSLRAERIEPFLGARANASEQGQRWTPVSDAVLAEIARRSRERVQGEEIFVEIERELAERAADDGVVKLAELIAEREKEQTVARAGGGASVGSDTASVTVDAEDEAESPPSPQAEEALRILGDLVLLGS